MAAQALIFDMDGTLIDSTAVISNLWRAWAARHGVDPDEVLRSSPGRRAIDTIRLFAPAGVDAAAEAAMLAKAASETTMGLQTVAGAATLLHSLSPLRWAVVTSAELEPC
jgi:sugar-phosphatase